ncbi:hypothetical protein JTB14_008479 [Gonioctena quinquepunctata]|nr:hypothetical protein JTB14_008479 [Gonioctena quinquepunctata]
MPICLFIIQNISNIKVQENDILPKQICNGCDKKLEDIYRFIKMCNDNNDVLNAVQTSQNDNFVKIEDSDNPLCSTIREIEEDVESLKSEDHFDHTYADAVLDHIGSFTFKCILCDWTGVTKKALKEHENEHLEILTALK